MPFSTTFRRKSPPSFTGRQVVAIVAGLVLAVVLFPIGARATGGSLVTIVDEATTNTAKVDSDGAVLVTNPKDHSLQVAIDSQANTVRLDQNFQGNLVQVDTSQNPVRVRDSSEYSPYQKRLDLSMPDGHRSAQDFFPIIPAGSRLVIQNVAGYVAGRTSPSAEILIETSATSGRFLHFPFILARGPAGNLSWLYNQQMTAYAGPGTRIQFHITSGDETGHAAASLVLTGYLIPVGSG